MMKFLKHLLVVSFVLIVSICRGGEGMWLPLLLEKMNEKEMKSLGMKISAKDIYSINSGSLKDAIVSFNGNCTGEVISSKGLVLTNHHCGFDMIQNHSTLDNNYIRNGFWAKNYSEEIPNEKLFVTFIVRIEDVSKQVLNGVLSTMTESERQSRIDKNIDILRQNVKIEAQQDGFIRGFFEANQYYMFITETYRDIRLVGAPPSSIGNFGQDTDNWIWPRHTGDFSMFRIYAGKDNKPAAYSPENIPYTPKRSLAISMDGVKEGDFTMVFGFPGRTTEYLHSSAVEQIMTVNDPAKIAIRDKALAVLDGFMRRDEQIKIQYAYKYSSISNAWKKWQGEVLGLTRSDAVGKKKAAEAIFQQRVNANPAWKAKYGNLLNDLSQAYAELKPLGLARDYYNEIIPRIELFTIVSHLQLLVNTHEKEGANAYQQKLPAEKGFLEGLYAEFNKEVDKKLFENLMEMYASQDDQFVSPLLKEMLAGSDNSLARLASRLYDKQSYTDKATVMALLDNNGAQFLAAEAMKNSEINRLVVNIQSTWQQFQSRLNEVQNRINSLQRLYMQAQMEIMKEKKFYPDANGTLRLTYGNVKPYNARDAVKYDYYTYLDGVMEKYKPGDYEFDVPEKLRELYRKKDYGPYGSNGKMPVCFIASNHTTGGNSGSPALDAYGNLVGLNFDRVWEGTMSDINYDPSICRNIMVDIRYVLFVVDKYAGAGHLVKEMKLVHPKKK